jgi:hypothetical protein
VGDSLEHCAGNGLPDADANRYGIGNTDRQHDAYTFGYTNGQHDANRHQYTYGDGNTDSYGHPLPYPIPHGDPTNVF